MVSALARAYTIAIVLVAAATLVGKLLALHVDLADEAMLYVLAIVFAALGGRGPALTASVLSVAAFDFFFVFPRYTFDVADTRTPLTFAVMIVVGVVIATLIDRLRRSEAASREREKRQENGEESAHESPRFCRLRRSALERSHM